MGLIWITSSSFPSLPWTQAISRGTLWRPPAPFFHSVSLPLAQACWWLEAKELSGNWIQSQDNKDKNKMQVRSTPCPLLSQKTSPLLPMADGERHLSWQRFTARLPEESEYWQTKRAGRDERPQKHGVTYVCLRKVGHTCPRTLNYQINKLEKLHFKSNCIDLLDVPWTHQINHIRIKSNQKINYAFQ